MPSLPALALPGPVLAIDGGLVGQVVFVLLALLAWILREAAERKAAKREEQAVEGGGEPTPPSALERLARLFGDEADPDDGVAARVAARARARRETHPEEYVEQSMHEADPAAVPPPLEAAPVGDMRRIDLGGDLATTAHAVWDAPSRTPARRRHPRALRRLGLTRGSARAGLRRAVLWAEVLGPPRALRPAGRRAVGAPPRAAR